MLSILLKTLNDRKWTILIFSLIGAFFVWIFISLYPTVHNSSQNVSDFIQTLPEELKEAFGLDPKYFVTFEGFVAGKIYSLIWPILLIALLVANASAAIAGEVEKRTIEVVLALPIDRLKIYFSQLAAQLVALTLFVACSVLIVIPLTQAYGITTNDEGFLLFALAGFCFGLAVLGLSNLFSSVFSESGKSSMTVIGILLAMYVANLLALLEDRFDAVKYFSLFHYLDYTKILVDSNIDSVGIIVFVATFVVASTFGLVTFVKRDIPN